MEWGVLAPGEQAADSRPPLQARGTRDSTRCSGAKQQKEARGVNPSLVAAGHELMHVQVVPETGALVGTADFKGPGREIFVGSLEGLNGPFSFSRSWARGAPAEALLLGKALGATLLGQKPPSPGTVGAGPEGAQRERQQPRGALPRGGV